VTDLHYLTITELAARLAARELSPVEVTEAMLARIDALDGHLHSYLTVTADLALAAAEEAANEIAAGRHRGPLHGVPFAVKDLCATAGVRTTGGMAIHADHVPDEDATVVSRLAAAGTVPLGKLNMTEGALIGYHPDFPVPRNPWGEDRWPGASSSGSGAATAAGLCYGSLGSDTGGSIRFPAAACGIVGLKPTYGRVSRHGVFDLAETLDHVGPIVRSSADAAAVLGAIAGYDPADPTTRREPVGDLLEGIDGGVDRLRIGYDERYGRDGVEPPVVAAVEAALDVLAGLGAEVVAVEAPDVDEWAWMVLCTADLVAAHQGTYPERADEYGVLLREFLDNGARVTGAEYVVADRERRRFTARLADVLADVDVLACPAMVGPPSVVDPEAFHGGSDVILAQLPASLSRFTSRFDMSGSPTITLPSGFDEQGAPLAVQFVGRPLDEALLCRLGHTFEQATPWHTHHPDQRFSGSSREARG
jgi:amidase